MTIFQVLRILVARRRWIFVSLAIAMLAAIAAILVLPKKYKATATVVVNSLGNDPLAPSNSRGAQGGVSMGTQTDIIKRPRVAKQVVKDLGLDTDPKLRAAWQEGGQQEDYETWLSKVVGGGLLVATTSDSDVLEISYVSTDPKEAALRANAFAKAYLSTALQLKTSPASQFVTFFDERIAELRKRLEDAQGRSSTYQKTTGLVNAGDKSDMENSRLSDLSTQLAIAQAAQADTSSRQRSVRGNASVSPEVMGSALVQQLKSMVSSQQVKVAQLSLRLGPNHPELLRAQGELREMQARLSSEVGQVASSLGSADRISDDRVAALRAQIDQQRQRVLSLQGQRDQADVLQKEVQNAQRAYDTVMQRQSQVLLESQAQQSDVALLDSASVPALPFSPRIPLLIALGVIGGLVAGVLLALLREFSVPLVRSSDDLVIYTGLPVLTRVPSARLASIPRLRFGTGRRDVPALPA